MKTKRLATTMLAVALVIGGAVTTFSDIHAASSKSRVVEPSEVTLKWDDKVIPTQGMMSEGQILIPVTVLRDDVKLPVFYSIPEKSYVIDAGYNTLIVMTGDNDVYVTVNKVNTHDMQARIMNNRLYVPVNVLKNYVGINAAWDASSRTVSLTKSPLNPISIQAVSLWKADSGKMSINLNYPQLTGEQPGVAAINAVLKKYVEQTAADVKQQIKEAGEPVANRPYDFDNSWVVTYNEKGYVSLMIESYSDTGGAHGSTIRKAFTFSLADGKQLGLGEVLKANPRYKKVLNKKLRKQVPIREGYLGGFKELPDQPDFYVTGTKIIIFFQQSEYTAYAAGFPEFSFTFKKLLPAGAKPFGK